MGREVWERPTHYRQLQSHWMHDMGIDKKAPDLDFQIKVSFLVEVAVELNPGGQQSYPVGCQPNSR